jgi:hypothetical protein
MTTLRTFDGRALRHSDCCLDSSSSDISLFLDIRISGGDSSTTTRSGFGKTQPMARISGVGAFNR